MPNSLRPSGWIILDKPLGLGSTQAVGAVKRNLREAGYGKVKVGHGGTLDPLASGVLPIALGEATKLCGRMLDASKVYAFTVQFGSETDTLDLEGKVIATSDVLPTLAQIEAVLSRFTGEIDQVPPIYSALMVDGARAYDRARAGEVVELKARRINVLSLYIRHAELVSASTVQSNPELSGLAEPNATFSKDGSGLLQELTLKRVQGDELVREVTLEAHVSKGTYIRSLARDIARALGSVGHVMMLRRLRAGPFSLNEAISLDNLNDVGKGASLENVLLPLEAGLDDIPALNLSPEQASMVRQGRVLSGLPCDDGLHWARLGRTPVALMELNGGNAVVVRGFNLPDVAE